MASNAPFLEKVEDSFNTVRPTEILFSCCCLQLPVGLYRFCRSHPPAALGPKETVAEGQRQRG